MSNNVPYPIILTPYSPDGNVSNNDKVFATVNINHDNGELEIVDIKGEVEEGFYTVDENLKNLIDLKEPDSGFDVATLFIKEEKTLTPTSKEDVDKLASL